MTYDEQDAQHTNPQSITPYTQELPIQVQLVQQHPDEEEIDIKRYFLAMRHRWRLMAVIVAAFVAVGGLYVFTRKPIYEANIKLLISAAKTNPLMSIGASMSMPTEIQSMLGNRSVETQIDILSDESLQEKAFFSFSKPAREKAFGDTKHMPEWVVDVSAKRSSDVVVVSTQSYVPSNAVEMADKIVDLYLKRDMEISNNAIVKARKYAQEKMQLAEKELKDANEKLAEFKKECGLVAPEVQLAKTAEYMAALQTELEMSKAELAATRGETTALRQQIAEEAPEVVSSTILKQNPRLAAAIQDIDKLYANRIELLQEYKPQAPEIKAVDNRIRDQERLLQKLTETIVESEVRARNPIRDTQLTGYSGVVAKEAALEAKIGAIDRELNLQVDRSKMLPEKERMLTEYMQRAEMLERTFGLMSDKYYALVLSEQGRMPSAHVISSTRIEPEPVYPRRFRTLALFFLLGAAAAVACVVLLEQFDGRVRESGNTDHIAGVPVLGRISARNGAASLISRISTPSSLLEDIRVLRNNICLVGSGSRLRTLAITGTEQAEGKSITAANLAMAMAMDGKRTILVDCNLHSPSLGALIEARYDAGLMNVISGGCDLSKAVVETDVENMWFLSTGPMTLNSTEILNSEQSREVIRQLATGYDFVVLNCPSTDSLSDVQVLSTLADGLLMVVSPNWTREPDLQSALQALRRVGGKLLGLVLVDGGRRNSRNSLTINASRHSTLNSNRSQAKTGTRQRV